jgi:Ran GTPase-activating protein (RanGAP) involved in mRNA processing and transport
MSLDIPNVPTDNRAISSVNLLSNNIGTEEARALASILKDHPTLKSLCGNKGNETELDMSSKMKGAAGAIMLVPEITDNGALSVLSLKSNNLYAVGCKALAEGLKDNHLITELNIVDCNLSNGGSDMSGVIALANAIPNMEALSSLDVSSNGIGQGQYLGDGKYATETAGKHLEAAVVLLMYTSCRHGRTCRCHQG